MTTNKRITIFGATGAQGSSVMRSLLANSSGQFQIRGTTRNTNSEAAEALTALGGEMVQVLELNHDALVDVFKGSWGLFLNTHPLLGAGEIKEPEIGKNLVDAAAAAGVRTIVYSALPSASDATSGVIKNSDFDDKAAIANYIKAKGFENFIFTAAGWYMSSFLEGELVGPEPDGGQFGGFPIKEDAEGFLSFKFPAMADGELPLIDMDRDYGDIVHGVFLAPQQHSGQFIQAYSQAITLQNLVHEFQRVTGRKSRYIPTDWKAIKTHGEEELEIVKSMIGYIETTGGFYYAEKNNKESAILLKAMAVEAKGQEECNNQLSSIEAFLTKQLST